MDKVLRMSARPLELLVGAFFVFAALLKVQNPQLFAIQIHEYQVVTDSELLAPLALFFLTLEMVLGFAMLVGLRLRTLVHLIVSALLVAFTGLIAYAWYTHGIEDCGCMGEVRMGPGVSILKNLVLLAMLGWSWLGFLRKETAGGTEVMDKLVATVVFGIVTVATVYPDLYRAEVTLPEEEAAPSDPAAEAMPPQPPEPASDGPFARFRVQALTGETHDLGRGRYLVVMFSATCDHCLASIPLLNEYTLYGPDLPPVVGLVYEPGTGDLDAFEALGAPQFPLHSIGDDFIRFTRYIGREPPRLHLVEDGHSVHFWDEDTLPRAEEALVFLAEHPDLAPVDAGAMTMPR